MVVKLLLKSRLNTAMRPQLEQVFFFNLLQSKWRDQIRRVVDQYGVPELIDSGQELTLGIRGSEQTQSLFAVDSDHPDQLVGIIVWGRYDHEEALVLHLAVDGTPPHSAGDNRDSAALVVFAELVNAFLKVVERIAGIERVRFAYWDRVINLLPASRHPAAVAA